MSVSSFSSLFISVSLHLCPSSSLLSLLFHLLFSLLLCLLSLSLSRSLSLCLSPCDVVCDVVSLLCWVGVRCVWCVWCRTLNKKRGKNTVCRFKTFPCVPATGPHVQNMWICCRSTRRRLESTQESKDRNEKSFPHTSTPLRPPPRPHVEFLCSHETKAQCCDSSLSVRVAQLVVPVLISTLTSHAGLESYQSQTHLPSQRAQHTCDTCLTLHCSGAELRTPLCCAASWKLA